MASPQAGRLPRRVRWAAFIAGGNVMGLALGALLALAFELPSLSWIGVALAALACNEWRGRRLLLAGDVRASRSLALNQLFSFLVIAVYCAHAAHEVWAGPSPLDAALRARPELAEVLGGEGLRASLDELDEWGRRAALVTYAAVAAGSLVAQGLTAALYLSLRSALAAGPPRATPRP